jgi:hypothetical protein
MKTKIKLIAPIIALFFLAASCTDETTSESKDLQLSVQLKSDSGCKHLKSSAINTSASESCLEYSFNQETEKLTLKHINAGFNCCPESLWCTVVYRNDSIIVQEHEKHMGCKCNCLYDLDIEINGVEAGSYKFRLLEPYLGTQMPLTFTFDLKTKPQGSFCVSRSNYPWGM